MIHQVATVIRCGHLARLVLPTVVSVEQQRGSGAEIVLLTDESTSPGARAWIAALARHRGHVHVHSSARTPGAVRNAGVDAVRRPYLHCLDAGDLLDRSYHTNAGSLLDGADQTAFVTSGLLILGPGGERTLAEEPVVDIPTLAADPEAVHSAAVFRHSAWRASGGFDESLPALESYDFWLMLLEQYGACAVMEAGLVVRPRRTDGLYRLDWRDEARAAALHEILLRHAASVGSDPAQVLFGREQRLRALGDRYGAALARRDQAVEHIDALKARRVALVGQLLPDHSADLGDLRRTTPISADWGYERGAPVDRHYIEEFLARQAADIAGVVLEVQEADYTRRFGGDRVTHSDVLDLDATNTRATVIADLRCAPNIPSDTYDCIILTQTLHVIDDMEAVVSECARILKPGGVLLATLPCASRVSVEYGFDGDFWRVTDAGARRIFGVAFPATQLAVESRGNVLVNAAFLYGLGGQELTPEEYDATDPYFPALITVRAWKPAAAELGNSWSQRGHFSRSRPGLDHSGAAILMYHRIASPLTDAHHLAVPPAEFREHMTYLRDHYEPVSLSELARAVRTGTLRPGTVAVTFDDGYADNLEHASPVLADLGVPATFFLTTARMNDACEYWWDALETILLTPGVSLPEELAIELPDSHRRFATRGPVDRLAAYWDIYRAIVAGSAGARDDVIETLRHWSGLATTSSSVRRMTSAEIVTLAGRPGHDIGAHSVNHLMLPKQPVEVQRAEILESKCALEAMLGRTIEAFAYPFGAWDDATREAARGCGVTVAVACDDGAIPRHPDLLALPRLDVASRGDERFDDWLRRRVGPPRMPGHGAAIALPEIAPGRTAETAARRALVAGWFSYPHSDSTAGDLLACDLVCEWLAEAGFTCDVALAPPFPGGVDLTQVNPHDYSHAVFVCGPFMPNRQEQEFFERFRGCVFVGVNLSLPVPLSQWNPFDLLFERDSSEAANPDITFAAHARPVPVIGVCLVEPYDGADVSAATAAVNRLLLTREMSVVPIDTRADINTTGLRTKAEVESLLARMDVVVTTRLHGTVLSLKNGIPVVAIDPERGGAKIKRQAELIGWPAVFTVDDLDERALEAALDYCLTPEARMRAQECRDRAIQLVADLRRRFVAAVPTSLSSSSSPTTPSSTDPARSSSAPRAT